MKNGILLLVCSFLSACGSLMNNGSGSVATPTPTATSTAAAESTRQFRGSVQYAFDLKVDGETYSDIEAYYTHVQSQLPEKVQAAGYTDFDSVDFTGKLGFTDFLQDMDVYVASSENVQGNGKVDAQGNFTVAVERIKDTTAVKFKVRALKRVAIVLSKASVVTQRICFNFSAVEKDVVENPIILGNFETDWTLYDCQQQTNGMVIPPAAPSTNLRSIEICPESDQTCRIFNVLINDSYRFLVTKQTGLSLYQQEFELPIGETGALVATGPQVQLAPQCGTDAVMGSGPYLVDGKLSVGCANMPPHYALRLDGYDGYSEAFENPNVTYDDGDVIMKASATNTYKIVSGMNASVWVSGVVQSTFRLRPEYVTRAVNVGRKVVGFTTCYADPAHCDGRSYGFGYIDFENAGRWTPISSISEAGSLGVFHSNLVIRSYTKLYFYSNIF